MLLDPRGLLLAGLRALLQPVAAAQVPPADLRVGFFDPQTAAALSSGLPLVVLSLGQAKLVDSKTAGFGASTYGGKDQYGNVTVLTAKQYLETPVTITCVAAGLVADGIVGALAQSVALALFNTPSVPLPDSIDTFAVVD